MSAEDIYNDTMYVSFICDSCGHFVHAPASDEFQLVRCGNCGARFLGEFNQWDEQVKDNS